jgi:hypothetical protein
MLREQGGAISDTQWEQITSVYPPALYAEENNSVVVPRAMRYTEASQ